MSCDVGCRHSLDLVLLWPWRRPEATAPIGPLAWESPYATGVALRKDKKTKKKKICMDEETEAQYLAVLKPFSN